MKRRLLFILLIAAAIGAVVYFAIVSRRREIVLTGIVTTDEVVISSEITGRLQHLLVRQGDRVTNGQLIAVIQPQERKAELDFYTNSAQQSSAQVTEAEADLDFQKAQSSNLIWQSEANLDATKDQVAQAQADLENAELTFKREQDLNKHQRPDRRPARGGGRQQGPARGGVRPVPAGAGAVGLHPNPRPVGRDR